MGKEIGALKPVVCFGSNMQDKQWAERIGSLLPTETVILPGQEIVFDTYSSRYPNGAVANIRSNPQRRVVARIRYLSPDALTILDGFERGYNRQTTDVVFPNGSTKRAEVYVAKPELVIAQTQPHPEYLRKILDGIDDAGDFPREYIDEILKASKPC